MLTHNIQQIKQIEESVHTSLRTTEKIYHFFDQDTTKTMRKNTRHLIDLYKIEPDFNHWDFDQLKDELGMDIYIIDEQNTIIHSTLESDLGINFNECCQKLAKILDKRRSIGSFFVDSMDIEQETGFIKKYSYTATPDKKYLIELSLPLQNSLIFNEFSFLNATADLVSYYPSLNEINIINYGGYSFDGPIEERILQKERREAFERAIETKQQTTFEGTWEGEPASYHYSYYTAQYASEVTTDKVLEIIFNKHELQEWLKRTKSSYLVELILSILASIIISAIIARLTAKPFYLAFHDSLTGLKNRAALYEEFDSIASEQTPHAILLIDLDNFKEINDQLGHDEGDRLLKHVAHLIHATVKGFGESFRLGGDEFVVIIPFTNEKEVENLAQKITTSIYQSVIEKYEKHGIVVTVSIGISLSSSESNNPEELLKKADLALYHSKEKGKNQYHLYTDQLKGESF